MTTRAARWVTCQGPTEAIKNRIKRIKRTGSASAGSRTTGSARCSSPADRTGDLLDIITPRRNPMSQLCTDHEGGWTLNDRCVACTSVREIVGWL